jgi:hypothetical protein
MYYIYKEIPELLKFLPKKLWLIIQKQHYLFNKILLKSIFKPRRIYIYNFNIDIRRFVNQAINL